MSDIFIPTAEQARFSSINGKKLQEIRSRISEYIEGATKSGKLDCNVSIPISTNSAIRERIIEEMTNLGYDISISDVAKEEKGAPPDQCSYYDVISISWEEE